MQISLVMLPNCKSEDDKRDLETAGKKKDLVAMTTHKPAMSQFSFYCKNESSVGCINRTSCSLEGMWNQLLMALLVPQLSTVPRSACDPSGEPWSKWDRALENEASEEELFDWQVCLIRVWGEALGVRVYRNQQQQGLLQLEPGTYCFTAVMGIQPHPWV